VGRDFDEVMHILWSPEYADEIVRLYHHTLETGEPYFAPERIEERRDRGVLEYYEWQINRITLPEGGYGVVCYFRDISAQVHARREAEQARELAETANRIKSEFLAVMSHELRTPLNAIAGYVDLIDMGVHGPVTASQREALSRIQRSGKHLLALINDVLNFAKLEAGRVEYIPRDVKLADAVASVSPMIDSQLRAKGLSYEVHVDPTIIARVGRNAERRGCGRSGACDTAGLRYGHRHSAGQALSHLRPIRAGASEADEFGRGLGSRPCHQSRSRTRHGRRSAGEQCGG
jgi:signal transduction histidine kinase